MIDRIKYLLLFLAVLGVVSYSQVKAVQPLASPIYSGTGFFVQDQVILTARHVIVGHKVLTVYYDGKAYLASVIAEDRSKDLALLRINTGAYTPYALIGTSSNGLKIVLKGYDLGIPRLMSHDGYFDWSVNQQGLEAVRTSDRICEGDSGGPAVSPDNKVVGVIDEGSLEDKDFVREGCSRLGWVVPTDQINKFLVATSIRPDTTTSIINIVYIENQT